MNLAMRTFKQQNPKLDVSKHPSDNSFLILKNCSLATGGKLCAKYGASGHVVGKNDTDFAIGNFGRYSNLKN